jgi:hypothetical protein
MWISSNLDKGHVQYVHARTLLCAWRVPVVERSKTTVCGRSFAGIADSNPPGVMDVRLLSVLCAIK